jgi:hypothetical protein
MAKRPRDGAPGTTDQSRRWEGPPENRPAGYLPALDNPETDRDAAGENLSDPQKTDIFDALKTRGDGSDESRHQCIQQRAYELWEREGRQEGTHERHWHDAVREIDDEDDAASRPVA